MEGTANYSLCILCSHSFPNSSENPPNEETVKTINQFLQQTGVVDRKCFSSGSGGLLGLKKVSICPQCLVGVGKAVAKRKEVEKAEKHVRSVQAYLLKLMRGMAGLVEGHLEEMVNLEGKIKGGDPGCLRVVAELGGGPINEGAWSWENVFQFRDGIVKVTKEMSQFKTNLVQRNEGGDARERGNDEGRPELPGDLGNLEDTSARPSSSINLQANAIVSAQTKPEVGPGRDKADHERARNSFKMAGSSKSSGLATSNLKAPHGLMKGTKAMAQATNVHLLEFEKVPGASKKLKVPSRKKRMLSKSKDKTAKEEYLFSCPVCGKGFFHPGFRKRHLQMAHLDDKQKWKCEVCGKGFAMKCHLTQHSNCAKGQSSE